MESFLLQFVVGQAANLTGLYGYGSGRAKPQTLKLVYVHKFNTRRLARQSRDTLSGGLMLNPDPFTNGAISSLVKITENQTK